MTQQMMQNPQLMENMMRNNPFLGGMAAPPAAGVFGGGSGLAPPPPLLDAGLQARYAQVATNPAVVQPDAGRVRHGLAREDLFTVVIEHFVTDTARLADVVLPSTTQLEHFDVQGAWGHHYISVNNPAVSPLGEAKSHGEIMRMLARRLGLGHAALKETDEQIAASVLPPGIDLQSLKAQGWYKSAPMRPGFDPKHGMLRLGSLLGLRDCQLL